MPNESRPILNPELEHVREKAEKPPDLDQTINDLINRTNRIHAGFMFSTASGKSLLQRLCQCLSATKISPLYAGWEECGIALGINPIKIQCIKHQFKESDPSQLMLKVYVQQEDATLDKIVSSLKTIDRKDIIEQTKHMILNLANDVTQNYVNNDDDSGYCSLSDSNIGDRNEILRPTLYPEVELIFHQDLSSSCLTTSTISPYSPRIENELYVEACPDNIPNRRHQNEHDYSSTVMLTFALDGSDTAADIAKIFRRREGNHPPIGVVILNEHADKVNCYPSEFIHSCFTQVDYIFPIITRDYLNIITNISTPLNTSLSCIDQNYVKFIYKEMETDYLRRGCINKKVRCVIPDNFVQRAQQHSKMSEPLFQAWVRASEVSQLKQRILNVTF